MHEIVKLYDLLIDHNEIAQEEDMITIEISTHPLVIHIWDVVNNDVIKEFHSFQQASKWLESRILGLAND